DDALPLAPGDRLVLRDPGRKRTVAGAVVLEVEPSRRAKDAADHLARPLGERLLASHPWLAIADLPRLSGLSDADADALVDQLVHSERAVRIDRWLVAPDTLERVRTNAAERALAHHRKQPMEPGIELPALASALRITPEQLRAALDSAPELSVARGVVRHSSHASSASDSPEATALVAALMTSPFSPPAPSDVGADRALVRALVREGVLVDLDGVVFAADALTQARDRVVAALRAQGSVTVADIRDALGSTRKFVLPIVGWLDREGITRRRGDNRFPGPRSGVGEDVA